MMEGIGYWRLEIAIVGDSSQSSEDAGEFAVDEEISGGGGVVGLMEVSLDIRGGVCQPAGRVQCVVEQRGDALASGGGSQEAPVVRAES